MPDTFDPRLFLLCHSPTSRPELDSTQGSEVTNSCYYSYWSWYRTFLLARLLSLLQFENRDCSALFQRLNQERTKMTQKHFEKKNQIVTDRNWAKWQKQRWGSLATLLISVPLLLLSTVTSFCSFGDSLPYLPFSLMSFPWLPAPVAQESYLT